MPRNPAEIPTEAQLQPGALVTYDDEPDPPTFVATVVQPTDLEVAEACGYEYPPLPEDVMVEFSWPDEAEPSRSWESPSGLRLVAPAVGEAS